MECVHGLESEFCSYCRDKRVVYISGGGSVFHRTPDCTSLESGKQQILDRGGELAKVTSTYQSNAESMGRRACRTCA